jgi:hypothetical protein
LYVRYKRAWQKVGAGGTIGGSGTTNYIPKFTSSTAIGNSQIFDDGTDVLINTTTFNNGGLSVSASGLNINKSVPIMLMRESGTGNTFYNGIALGRSYIGSENNIPIVFLTNNLERVKIDSTGNVGIGTTSPGARLTIVSTGTGSEGLRVDGSGGGFALVTNGGTSYKTSMRNTTIGSGYISNTPPTDGLLVEGNVGIGTASPGRKLDVNGTSAFRDFTSVFAGAGNIVSNITWLSTDNGIMNLYSGGVEKVQLNSSGASYFTGGNVLIGTTTDNGVDRLQVSGSMSVSARATAQNLSVTTNATVGGDATISGNTRINGLVGINTAPSGYALSFAATGSNIINLTTQATNNINIFAHSSSQQFGQIGNASGALSGGSNNDMAVGAVGASNNLILYSNSAERVRVTSAGRVLANTTTDNGVDQLQVNGSISGNGFEQAYLARTTTYTATTSDYFIDCTSGTFTVNLFTAVGNTGRILIIKNSGTGTITVDPNGTQTIDGATTQTLSTQWSRVHIISDGANWKIISN